MAQLEIIAGPDAGKLFLLHGLVLLGRSSDNAIYLSDVSASRRHALVVQRASGFVIEDLHSTNGTFVDGEPVTEAQLHAGEILSLGEVELLVQSTDVRIAIPKIEPPVRTAPPVVLSDGGLLCPRHPRARVTHQCTHCREVMCDACVHKLRRRGGKVLKLCPLCSHKCESLTGAGKKKRSVLGFLQKTVKLPFLHARRKQDDP